MPKRKWISSTAPRAFSQYTALNKDKQEIRVVSLHAGADDAPISCTVETVLLSQARPFSALSYCWGSADDIAVITLNGDSVTIRRNLWYFLKSLRHLKGTLSIWVDYICINQEDVAERGHQVQLMADIYKNAHTVYAWLGRSTESSDLTMDHMMEHSLALGRPHNATAYWGYKELVRRAYWARIWIVQELVLAKEIWVVVGRKTVRWDTFVNTFRLDGDHDDRSMIVFSRIRRLIKGQRSASQPDLPTLVYDFCDCLCQDPRDRIFGMLGLLEPSIRSMITVDYHQTIIELCLNNIHLVTDPYMSAGEYAKQHPQLQILDSNVIEFISNICGDAGRASEVAMWAGDMSLRRRLIHSLVLDARVDYLTCIYHTFAAMKTVTCKWEPFTAFNRSERFAVYLTKVRFVYTLESDHAESSVVIISTTLPEAGDLVIDGPTPFYCLARKDRDSFQIYELAVAAKCLSKGMSPGSAGTYVQQWLRARIPDMHYSFAVRPKVFDPDTKVGVVDMHWPVRLNASAIAEAVRWYDFGRGGRVPVLISWDPGIYLYSRGKDIPSRDQYNTLSYRMRLALSARSAGLPADTDKKQRYREVLFWTNADITFNHLIPRARTDALEVSEIKASFRWRKQLPD